MFTIEKTTSKIIEWYAHFKNNNIDFNPPYQRVGGIWSLESKQLLIDSIFNKLDIPKFYVNYFVTKGNTLNPNEKLFAIIDGKQRFYAMFEFMEDKFPLSNNFELIDEPEIKINGLKYSEISLRYPNFKHHFDNYKLDIALVITDEQERIEELFLRLNEGKQLNNAEKRYAISGHLSSEIKCLTRKHSFLNKVGFKDKRYDYFDVITKLFLLDSNDEVLSLNKTNLDNFLKKNRIMSNDMIYEFRNFESNLDMFSSIFNEEDPLLNSKSKIPLYYIFFKNINTRDLNLIHKFLTEFEELILKNRISDNKNELLLEYDRLTQQGTISKGSIESRLKILHFYYDSFVKNRYKLDILENIPIEFDE